MMSSIYLTFYSILQKSKKFFTMPTFFKVDESLEGSKENMPTANTKMVKRNSGALNTLDTS